MLARREAPTAIFKIADAIGLRFPARHPLIPRGGVHPGEKHPRGRCDAREITRATRVSAKQR